MPSSNHALDEYREYLDFLWALYDSLSADSFVLVMGDLNGDLGNSLGDKGLKEPNERGKLLLDFANYFNLCPINLLTICDGPLETYPTVENTDLRLTIYFCQTVYRTV